MSERPPTSTSGFGVVTVTGRMRLPTPAASTIARLGRMGAVFQSKSGGGISGAAVMGRSG